MSEDESNKPLSDSENLGTLAVRAETKIISLSGQQNKISQSYLSFRK